MSVINEPPAFKGVNIRGLIEMPINGRGVIN